MDSTDRCSLINVRKCNYRNVDIFQPVKKFLTISSGMNEVYGTGRLWETFDRTSQAKIYLTPELQPSQFGPWYSFLKITLVIFNFYLLSSAIKSRLVIGQIRSEISKFICLAVLPLTVSCNEILKTVRSSNLKSSKFITLSISENGLPGVFIRTSHRFLLYRY